MQFRIRDGCTVRELPDGDAVVALGEGDTAVIINASAHAVLDLLTVTRSQQELVSLLRDRFPSEDAATIERDVTALLSELVRANIVEPCGAGSSTA